MSAPYKYDIVGSFLRDKEIKQARKDFSLGKINQSQLEEIENKSIENLVNEEKAVGLKAVTDGEFRRAFWHLDFLWDLKGVEKVAVEHFSIAFKGHQPKSQTLEIVDKIDFPEDHPFLKHFKFMQRVSGETEVKQCIPSPSMLHLICCIREENYQPIEKYQDNDVLLKDIAYAYQKAIKAFYNAGCRYLQLDDTSWGEFCSKEKREAYKARGIDVEGITHVINYDLPVEKEAYVHRIGRTGRAGARGKAISFVNQYEDRLLDMIEEYIGFEITVENEIFELSKDKRNEAIQFLKSKPKVKKEKSKDINKNITKLYFNGGKKKKLRAGDFVGAISRIEGITGEDIGIIDVQDNVSYVDILNGKGNKVIEALKNSTIKGKKLKVERARK